MMSWMKALLLCFSMCKQSHYNILKWWLVHPCPPYLPSAHSLGFVSTGQRFDQLYSQLLVQNTCSSRFFFFLFSPNKCFIWALQPALLTRQGGDIPCVPVGTVLSFHSGMLIGIGFKGTSFERRNLFESILVICFTLLNVTKAKGNLC